MEISEQDEADIQRQMKKVELADAKSKLETRKELVQSVLPYFRIATGWTIVIIVVLTIVDIVLILCSSEFSAADRIISTEVIIALIGATVVNVGIIAVMAGRWVFEQKV